MTETNLIPSLRASGRFEALTPFDQVVVPSTYYTVEAIRTIQEMQGLKLNLYQMIFQPIGVAEADYLTVLERAKAANAAVVTLTSRLGAPVYVLSTYFKSFPEVDGVVYERMCVVADLGACNPTMKPSLEQVLSHVKAYILDTIGIDAIVTLGTVPTLGYVSRANADIFENTRLNKIKLGDNDVARIRELQAQAVVDQNYIRLLESKLP